MPSRAIATAEGRKLARCHGPVDPVVSVVQAIGRFVPFAGFCRSKDGCRGIGADLCASVANASGPLWAEVLAQRRSGATDGGRTTDGGGRLPVGGGR